MTETPRPKLAAATKAAELVGYKVSITPCTSPFFPNTTEVRVSSDRFSAAEVVANFYLFRQADGGDEVLSLLVMKFTKRCRDFRGGGP